MVFGEKLNARKFYEKMGGNLLSDEKYFEKEEKNIKKQDMFTILMIMNRN